MVSRKKLNFFWKESVYTSETGKYKPIKSPAFYTDCVKSVRIFPHSD